MGYIYIYGGNKPTRANSKPTHPLLKPAFNPSVCPVLNVCPKHGAHLYYTNHDFTTQMLFLLHALCNNRPVSSASEFQSSSAAASSVNNMLNTA
jgi:hypothetical protein